MFGMQSKARWVGIFLILMLVLMGVFAIGQNIKYGGTLRYVVGTNSAVLVPTFNPFNANPSVSQLVSLIYEPLFLINSMTGKVVPMLGTSYKWSNDNLTLTVTTRKGVKWSDGVPFTANDVVFTFNLIKKYPVLDTSGIWSSESDLQTVEASGSNAVVFTFSKPNTPIFLYIAGEPIIPSAIWSNVKDPSTWADSNPVGTGPFEVESVNIPNKTVTLVKNPNYWMKDKPYIDKIFYTSALSNTMALEMMLSGKEDMGSVFLANVQKTWADKDPSVNKYFWPVESINTLLFNTLKYPFDNSTFRKAIALSINKESLLEKAYFNIGGVSNQTGIIPSQSNEWLDPTLKDLLNSFTYNPDAAQKLLESIGFKENAQGRLCDPSGKALPTFEIIVPAGATDFITMAQIISENLKAIGIEALTDQESGPTYMSSLMSGTYDMAVCWGTGSGPTPYYLYYNEFNPSLSAPIGQVAVSDYGRYTNPLVTSALKAYSQTSDVNLQKQAMYTIERIMLTDVPFVPLNGRTSFGSWSEKNFVGWPSASNPYASVYDSVELIFLNVHLK